MLLAYGAVLFVGGYEVDNHLASNATIASNYNAILSGSAVPGGFLGNVTKLGNVTNKTATGVNQTGNSGSSALTNSVGLVVGFMTSIPTIYWSIVSFIAVPLQGLGIPAGYAQNVVNIIILGIIAISIVSAIFLFPI